MDNSSLQSFDNRKKYDVVIVGGGFGGLTAATILARAGRSVVVLEKSRQVGGRAITQDQNGFLFNLGPHALYKGGPGMKVLRELGIQFSGREPQYGGALAIKDGRLHGLPAGAMSLMRTSLLSMRDKLELGWLLSGFMKLNAADFDNLSWREWIEIHAAQEDVQELLLALGRLWTYAGDADLQSAGAVIHQGQIGLAENVLYLDHGWQTIVDGLFDAAETAGAEIVTGAGVQSLKSLDAGFEIKMADDEIVQAAAVIVAASPDVAAALVPEASILREWADESVPIVASTLDVGFSSVPRPKNVFALGVDQPVYYSMHSHYADLAPENGAVVHVACYFEDYHHVVPKETERELERFLDLMQPGWREVCETKRFLPNLTVSNALVMAQKGGYRGRPGPEVPSMLDLYVIGDWVGNQGMLADAVLASAKEAAEMVLSQEKVFA